jgi:acyl carrier protein
MTTETLQALKDVISEVCDIDPDEIKLEANAIEDLGVDSLDFLDISFALEQRLGVKLPAEDWVEAINAGNADLADYFTIGKMVDYIDGVIKENN